MPSWLTPRRQNIALVVLAILVVPALTNHFMPRLLSGSTALLLAIGAAIGMAALSLNLLLGYAGQLSLGHGALIGVGAFAASTVVDRWGLPMPLALVVAGLAGGVIALAIGLPALRLRGLYLAIVTIVFGLAMQSSVLRWQFFTHGSAGANVPRRLLGETYLRSPISYLSLVLLVLLLVWLMDQNIMRSKIGRAFRILKEDEAAAQAFGVDVVRYKLLAFVVSGAMAGVAGALFGFAQGLVNSDMFTLQLSLRLVLIVILGGLGYRWGALLVAVLLSLSPRLPEFFQDYELVIAAGIVLYNIVHLPGGLAGTIADRKLEAAAPAVDDDDDEPRMPQLPAGFGGLSIEARGQELLAVDGMSVQFGGLRAVDGVSITVRQGSIVGIIGPNGAGKSTLFNAISGLVPGATGRVTVDGVDVTGQPPHRRAQLGLGRTFQGVGLARDMTLRESILLGQHRRASYSNLQALLFTRQAREQEEQLGLIADAYVEGLGLTDLADQRVRSLSGGQQRLVEIAAVLASTPAVLMLDEPTAGLSPAAAEELARRLHELRDDHGQTILLIEHNVPLVLDLCDYVYVLNAGAVLAEGPPSELAANPEILSAYLGEALV
jgi:branched-chain amino acid transport system permease protein